MKRSPPVMIPATMLAHQKRTQYIRPTELKKTKKILINIRRNPNNGLPIAMPALVDTGAEADLVRTNL